jgi:hypothetical protein
MTEEEIRASERLKCCAEVEAYAMEWVSRKQTRFPESDIAGRTEPADAPARCKRSNREREQRSS